MAFKVYDRNEKAIQEEFNRSQQGSGGDGVPLLYLKEGVTMVRILPPYNQRGVWWKQVREHVLIIEGRPVYLIAPSAGSPDPFSAEIDRLYQTGIESNISVARDLRARLAFYYNVICWSAPDGTDCKKGVITMKGGQKLHRQLQGYDQDYAMGYGNITDIEKGYTIAIERKGNTKENTEYTARPSRNQTNLADELAAKGVDLTNLTLPDLDTIFISKPAEELEDLLTRHMRSLAPEKRVHFSPSRHVESSLAAGFEKLGGERAAGDQPGEYGVSSSPVFPGSPATPIFNKPSNIPKIPRAIRPPPPDPEEK